MTDLLASLPATTSSGPNCPCRGCDQSAPSGKLMCLAHWQMVPVQTQRCVWAAYSSLRKRPNSINVKLYREVRQQAIDSVDRQGPLT